MITLSFQFHFCTSNWLLWMLSLAFLFTQDCSNRKERRLDQPPGWQGIGEMKPELCVKLDMSQEYDITVRRRDLILQILYTWEMIQMWFLELKKKHILRKACEIKKYKRKSKRSFMMIYNSIIIALRLGHPLRLVWNGYFPHWN